MKIRDKALKEMVDVSDKDCPNRPCYWPRPDPGVFSQGQGYRSRGYNAGWMCGTREAHGCPLKYCSELNDGAAVKGQDCLDTNHE